ncbi:hypothetical protein [Bordetella genomosp. 4]|uniref:Uncharacterized protein n=1 Tax=Bordetella genomosp. 4 TaxID=463044 RepID=A0A261U637_9BORD|nr:hypothetical protein [Bordetella genomosp. 4]OZI56730.1 hypothetical protein CAL20_15120 [Bordetella genomosp. 4]
MDGGIDVVSGWAQGNALVNALGLTGGSAVIVCVAIWLVRGVMRRDRVAEASAGGAVYSIEQIQQLVESLKAIISDQKTFIGDLLQRLDEAYAERNRALSEDGAKQARIDMLLQQISVAEARIQTLQSRIATLESLKKETLDGTASGQTN